MSIYTTTNCTSLPAICESERKREIAFLGSFSMFSVFVAFTMLCLMAYFQFWKKVRTRLVMYLLLSDMAQAIAITLCLGYFASPPKKGEMLCIVLGWLVTFGNNAICLWSANIAVFVALTIFFPIQWTPGRKYEIVSQLIWFFAVGIPSTCFLIAPLDDFFIPVSNGAWCWISPSFPAARMAMEYVLIVTVMVFLFIVYAYVGFYLWCRKNADSRAKKVVLQLAGFPVIFFIAYSPLAAVRITNGLGVNLPLEMAYVSVCFQACDGVLNALLYGFTRQIFAKLYMKMRSTKKREDQHLPLGKEKIQINE